MIFRALLSTAVSLILCHAVVADQMKAPATPKNPNVSAGLNSNLKELYRAKKQLELSSTLTTKLHRIRNTQNESFSRILQQAYKLERGKMPSKAKIDQLDKFLRQAVKFRNSDKQLSMKTLTRLVKANKSFNGLNRKPEGLQRFTSEIKNWDKARIATTKIYARVNGIRTKLGYSPLDPYKVQVVRRIATNDYRFLLEDSIRQKQDLTKTLLKSGKYKSKAEIRMAVQSKDPAVRDLAQLERRIRFLDKSLKANPLEQSKFKASKIHKKVTQLAQKTRIAQKGISFLNKMPANGSMLEAWRSQRHDIYHKLKASGDYKTWRDIKTALSNPKVNDPRIIKLRQIDSKIQKARYDIKMSKLPLASESKIFSNRWTKLNKELSQLKTLKNYAKTNNKIKATHLESLKLTQRSLYMEQSAIRLKHSLLADKTYSSPQELAKSLKSGDFKDPRMKSLARLDRDLVKTKAKITRSVSGKVGYITRLYNEAKANGQLPTKSTQLANIGRNLARSANATAKLGGQKLLQTSREAGTQIKQRTKELYIKGKRGFDRATGQALENGQKLYTRNGENFKQAKSVLVEKSGKLYKAGKNGLVRVKKSLDIKGSLLYKTSKNGVLRAIQNSPGKTANLYIKTKDGLSKATRSTLQSGAKLYKAGKNGVQKASGALITKGNKLFVMGKSGLARAKANTIKGAQRYYEITQNGTSKVSNSLGKTGGDLWVKTSDGISRASKSTIKQGARLYKISKNGLSTANNAVIEKSGQLYRSGRKGLVKIQDATKAGGSHIYRATSDGAYRAGKTISTKSSELYIKTKQGFQRATRSTLTNGVKVYSLSKEGLVSAKNFVVERAGKLYTSGKNGLTQIKKSSSKVTRVYRTAKNGVVSKVQSASSQISSLYTKGDNGLIKASKNAITKGGELYSVGKNGVQKVSRSALQKAGNLYTVTSNGVSRATGNTIKAGARVYQFSKAGLTQVKSGLVETGGKLYQTTKEGLTRVTKASARKSAKLFATTKDGTLKAVKASQMGANRLYASGKNGLIRVTQASLKTGTQLYTMGKDGVVKAGNALVSSGNKVYSHTKNGLVNATQSSIKAGTKLYNVGKNGVVKASNYVGSRIRMGQLNAGHQWILSGNSSNSAFLGSNYQPSSPGNTPSQAITSNKANSSNLMARMNPLNNFSANTAKPSPVTGPRPPAATAPKPGSGNPATGNQAAVWDKVKNSAWGKQTSQTGKDLAKRIGSLKGKSPTEISQHVKTVGNKVVDKTLAPNGYEVKRNAIAGKIQAKISQLNLDIVNAKANNQTAKAAKLEALRNSLQSEYNKSQVGPQGVKLQAQIKAITDQINHLKSNGGSKAEIKALKQIQSQKQQSLSELQTNKPVTAKSYVRDGLKFAVISAATQGILNLVDQVKNGNQVNVGDAFNFITSPEFVMGTSGAFAGGLIVQKTMASGFGKIMMHSIMNVIPGGPFVKSVVSVLPYTLGAMVGSDLLTGNLGQRGIGETLASGLGSSVGMILGSALFPPVGSIAGAVLGGMIADSLFKSFGANDDEELAVKMLYEPQWIEFNELAYTDEDTSELQTTMSASEEEFQAWMKPFLDGLTSVEELEQAKADTYQRYTNAVNDHGPDHPNAKNAYRLYQEISQRIEDARRSSEFSIGE